jgi:ribosome-associated protein
MKNKFLELAKIAYEIADSKKAIDPIVLNIKKLSAVADYLVIATAESSPQINAIIDTIYKTFRDKEGIDPTHRDGWHSDHWCVIDYGGLIVHVMTPATRKLYALEKIWDDAAIVKIAGTKAKTKKDSK